MSTSTTKTFNPSIADAQKIIYLGYNARLPRAKELLEEHNEEIRELFTKNGVDRDSDLVTGMQTLHNMLMQKNEQALSGKGRTRRKRSHRRRPHHRRTHHRRPHHRRTHHRRPHKKKLHRRKSHRKK